jgi:hypothetical protein
MSVKGRPTGEGWDMSEPTLPVRTLLGVFPSDRRDEVVDRLVQAGAAREEIRIGDGADERRSLEAEMHQEVSDGYVSPQVGAIFPKETVKATAVTGPIITVVCALLALPLAVFFPDSMPLWARLLTAAVCGAAAGGTIAVLAIPAMSVKNPQDRSAADRGVTVAVDRWSPDLQRAMAGAHPIRLDRLDERGISLGPVTTEEDEAEGGIVEELKGNFERELHADPEHKTR